MSEEKEREREATATQLLVRIVSRGQMRLSYWTNTTRKSVHYDGTAYRTVIACSGVVHRTVNAVNLHELYSLLVNALPKSVDASVLNRVKQRAKPCTKTRFLHKGHGVEPKAAYRFDHQMSTNTYLQCHLWTHLVVHVSPGTREDSYINQSTP